MEELRLEGNKEQETVPVETVPAPKVDLKAYNLKQIEIAQEVYARFHDEASVSMANENDIMKFWMDAGYSDTFRNIVRSETLANDPTLAGDISNLTADHILHFADPDHRQG